MGCRDQLAGRARCTGRAMEVPHDRLYALVEISGRWQQTEDKKRLARKVEEEAGMHEHAFSFEKADDEIVFRHQGWHLDRRVPPALDVEQPARWKRFYHAAQSLVIRTYPRMNG